ncbi:MAG: hypothetical protein Q9165_008323 [Trypethelium subeluteriae]
MSRQSTLSSGPIYLDPSSYHPTSRSHSAARAGLGDATTGFGSLSYGIQHQQTATGQQTLAFRAPSASLTALGYHHPTHPPPAAPAAPTAATAAAAAIAAAAAAAAASGGPPPAAAAALHLHQARPAAGHARMTTGYAPPPSEEELAYLQKLSNEYEPEVTELTSLLAIAFAYFEALARNGDKTKVHAEVTRVKSFQNILEAAGFQSDLCDDFAQELYDLLRKTAAAIPPPDNGNPATDVKALVFEAFNDESTQAGIITFLRILTSAWIKTHADDYSPFLMGEDVFSYCGRAIEPFRHEIENVGINALFEVLLKPAGFSLEIPYLDRTPGDEVNMYTFNAEYPITTIRLLYRPGHYDILYKIEDVQQPVHTPHSISAPVYIGAFPQHTQDHTDGARGLDYLHMIPGVSLVGSISPYSYEDSGFPSPISTHPPAMQQTLSVHPIPAHPAPASAYAPPPLQIPTHNVGVARLPIHASQGQARTGPFRPSIWELEPSVASGPPPQFTTSIFRK